MSANKDGNTQTPPAAEADAAIPAFNAPAPAASHELPPEKPNYMADVLARHEVISNRLNQKK